LKGGKLRVDAWAGPGQERKREKKKKEKRSPCPKRGDVAVEREKATNRLFREKGGGLVAMKRRISTEEKGERLS